MIDAQAVSFPVEAEEFNAAVLSFRVPAARARDLLADDTFHPVEREPGVAEVVVTAIDFIEHEWGSFHVVAVGLWASPACRPDAPAGLYLHQSPVDQRFSSEVAYRAQGVPTGVEQIEARYDDRDVTFALAERGQPTLALRVARGPRRGVSLRMDTWIYSSIGGVPHRALVRLAADAEVAAPAEAELELGGSPFALALGPLGLTGRPVTATWSEGLAATYHLARPLFRAEHQGAPAAAVH